MDPNCRTTYSVGIDDIDAQHKYFLRLIGCVERIIHTLDEIVSLDAGVQPGAKVPTNLQPGTLARIGAINRKLL